MKRIIFLSFILIAMMTTASNGQTGAAQGKNVKFVIHTKFGDMKGFLYNENTQAP